LQAVDHYHSVDRHNLVLALTLAACFYSNAVVVMKICTALSIATLAQVCLFASLLLIRLDETLATSSNHRLASNDEADNGMYSAENKQGAERMAYRAKLEANYKAKGETRRVSVYVRELRALFAAPIHRDIMGTTLRVCHHCQSIMHCTHHIDRF
jgi:hypothetical protein